MLENSEKVLEDRYNMSNKKKVIGNKQVLDYY